MVQRIKDLENEGRLSGVFDGTGVYVSLRSDQLSRMCSVVQAKGRISIQEIKNEIKDLLREGEKV